MPIVGVPQLVEPPPLSTPSVDELTFVLSRGGESLRLNRRNGYVVLSGVEGLDVPASEILEQRGAGQFGSYAVGMDVPAREVFLPLSVKAERGSALLDASALLDRMTTSLRGPVRLTVTRPDGSERWVEGHRQVPQTPVWDATTFFFPGSWKRIGLLLRCTDPWWRGEPVQDSWGQSSVGNFFPILPVELAPSQILGDPNTITVRGDAPTPPRWVITGPADSVTATWEDTARSWTLTPDTPLAMGETAVVDSDPRVLQTGPAVVGPDGTTSWLRYLDPPYDLWPLLPGPQTVSVAVTGATADTRVSVSIPALRETA